MRTAVVYYSYTGNTHRIAHIIIGVLKSKGEDAIPVRIRPLKEEKNFILQCKEAALSKKPELYRTLLDLKDYDRIVMGSPVWALKPAPALNTYLEKCSSLEGKDAICFVTYGSGLGKRKALSVLRKGLEEKGASVTREIFFQQRDSLDGCKKRLAEIL